MLKIEKLYVTEIDLCLETIRNVNFHSHTVDSYGLVCPVCNMKLLAQKDSENTKQEEMQLACRTCGAEPDTETTLLFTLSEATFSKTYIRVKDGGEDGPCLPCPECSNE